MPTRVFVQLEPESGDRRARSLAGAYAEGAESLRASLEASVAKLGPLTVLPMPAHEFNLKALLQQDLQAAGHALAEAPVSEGAAWVLVAKRVPSEAHQGQGGAAAAEVFALSYALEALPGA